MAENIPSEGIIVRIDIPLTSKPPAAATNHCNFFCDVVVGIIAIRRKVETSFLITMTRLMRKDRFDLH